MGRGTSVIAASLLILLPLPPSNMMIEDEMGEITIDVGRPLITSDWNQLIDEGKQPIRQISINELLVWGPINKNDLPAKKTEYRGFLTHHENYLIVLEPNINNNYREEIIGNIELLDLGITYISETNKISVNPQVVMISPKIPFNEWWPIIETMHGLHWVEPVLITKERNYESAALMQSGNISIHPSWLFGLDGTGVVIANADSGIDRDHACFREATESGASGSEWNNATGTPGNNHRKILYLNETIDDWDSPGDKNYLHGTHIAGSLGCRSVWEIAAENNGDWNNSIPGEGTSISHATKLVIEDVVGNEGWEIPEISELFWEAGKYGAVIRSDSWGDDTTEYTLRTSKFDTWLYQVPWSVSFVAPGNTGGEILEPANGLNVVSVGVSDKDGSDDLWTLSPRNKTEQGRMGVTIVAPGENIISAKGDGNHNSYNDEMKSSTGTSMATPQAAAAAAIIQQMVEDGWITGNESRAPINTATMRPNWAQHYDNNITNGNLLLGNGFTPSGPLIRALLTLGTDSLEGGRQAELTLGKAPDNQQGWGRINLSKLINFENINFELTNNSIEPGNNIWIHDSYRLEENNWQEWISNWVDGKETNGVSNHKWKGEGAAGPFISSGEEITWDIPIIEGQDVDIRLVWNTAPNLDSRDDLDLVVTLPNGEIFYGNDFQNLGEREDVETIEGVHISSEQLSGFTNITVKVVGTNINVGPEPNVIGLNGDKIGFAIAIKGVKRDLVVSKNQWDVVENNKYENEALNNIFSEHFTLIIVLISILFVSSIIAIDNIQSRGKNKQNELMMKSEPSNHERVSLVSAMRTRVGEDDE